MKKWFKSTIAVFKEIDKKDLEKLNIEQYNLIKNYINAFKNYERKLLLRYQFEKIDAKRNYQTKNRERIIEDIFKRINSAAARLQKAKGKINWEYEGVMNNSSCYLKLKNKIIRFSDHWQRGVASCDWFLNKFDSKVKKFKIGICDLSDFKYKR